MHLNIDYAPRDNKSRSVSPQLVGDWDCGGLRYRFNYDGTYSVVAVLPYAIVENHTLQFPRESYERMSGTAGLEGTWRQCFPSGEELDLTFGPFGFYSFQWNDGYSGGGYYSDEGAVLSIVEVRALVECSGCSVVFTMQDGTVENGTFHVVGSTLELTTPHGVFTYTRVPFRLRTKTPGTGGCAAKRFLAARFRALEGDASLDPMSTGSSALTPLPSLALEFDSDDFPIDQQGRCILLEVSLSLSNCWHNGGPGTGTEFEIAVNNCGRLRGQATIAADGQRLPIMVQGWVSNVTAPRKGETLAVEPWWRVLGTGTSYFASRGYGAASIRAVAYEL
jgi:hypothetical protein